MSGSRRSKSSGGEECSEMSSSLMELMEVNRRWKEEYDILKTRYQREKSELEEENHSLQVEVLGLKDELTRLAYAVSGGIHTQSDCCNGRAPQEIHGNGNVDQLMKEQLAVYKEDFKLEQEDKVKIQSEKKTLQERLLQCESHVRALSEELGVYKKECKRLQEKDELRLSAIKRHPSVDRSKSYPVTSSLSYEEDTVDPISSIALPPSMCGKREGYLSLRDFRHEQLKRGILVRNPSQGRSPTYSVSSTSKRLSDSTPPSSPTSPSNNQSYGKLESGRTSCLW